MCEKKEADFPFSLHGPLPYTCSLLEIIPPPQKKTFFPKQEFEIGIEKFTQNKNFFSNYTDLHTRGKYNMHIYQNGFFWDIDEY